MTGVAGGLLHGVVLDGNGGCREIDRGGVREWSSTVGPLWAHLDGTDEAAQAWLSEAGLDLAVRQALLSEMTRPRYVSEDEGLLLTLRGVNLNPGADPEDMVSIRIWVDAHRVITVQRKQVMTVGALHASLLDSRGPRSVSELVARLVRGLNERMAPVLDDIGDGLDDLEHAVAESPTTVDRNRLTSRRQQIIALRRFLAPQRGAMTELCEDASEVLTEGDRVSFRESANRIQRYVEDLDAARERAMVIQDELSSQMAEQLNARMYVLTVIAAIVLPLSLVAGMLGMNVAGMPGAESPWAFAITCGVFVVVGIALAGAFRWMKWL
jgi:zinc transporter